MNKIFILVIVSLFILSCSNKLTETKVEALINDCLSQNPFYGEAIILSGEISHYAAGNIDRYKKLEQKGFLKIKEKNAGNGWYTKYYKVALSDRLKPYILNTEKSIDGKSLLNKVKLYTLKVDKIGSIQEIPSQNTAAVSVTYKKGDKTPLYELFQSDETDYTTKKIKLRKTENQGWIYCEK